MTTTLADVMGLATAVGLGLLIGLVRERANGGAEALTVAGLRTHALLALLGGVGSTLGMPVLVVVLAGVALMTTVSYRRSSARDPGLTGEVTLLLTPLLGALAMHAPPLAAGLGVVIAGLLQAKTTLHRFSRELLTEEEVHDGLVLLASVLVILPLLPDTAIDPWEVLRPRALWRLVVLVMGVGMVGHVALRAVGARWGLPLAGFFAGMVSSTAAVAGYGASARQQPELAPYAAAAALLANLASLLLMVAIVASLSASLSAQSALPLTAAALMLGLGAAAGLLGAARDGVAPPPLRSRSFRVGHAVLLALIITLVLLISAIAQSHVGSDGALAIAALAALAEWHAAAASLAQMTVAKALSTQQAQVGLLWLLATSTLAKTALAFVSGGRRYGLWVGGGLLAMVLAATTAYLATRPA
jgi:uncharacterized membrane protein (DUF4010 family)